jgi:hypothetical protein
MRKAKAMRRHLRWRNLLYVLVLIVLLAFPYGPLFPWSPIHPGYQELRFTRADVLYPTGMELPDAYTHVNEYIERAERFHRLPMKSRVSVIMCRDWKDFQRFLPHLRGRGPGAVALFTGTAIYVTPKVAEKKFDIGEYIRHELSHAALNQNQSLVDAFRMMRQQWFCEGLAVSFGEQKSYISPQEFLDLARKQDLGPIIDPERRGEAPAPFSMRIGYQAWRYFLEYLIQARGRDLFQQYLAAYITHSRDYRSLFEQSYGVSLQQAIEHFQAEIRSGRWRPDPNFVSHHLN